MQQATTQDWQFYLSMMEHVLDVQLDETRRADLLLHFHRIATLATPLLTHSLDARDEIAGVFKP